MSDSIGAIRDLETEIRDDQIKLRGLENDLEKKTRELQQQEAEVKGIQKKISELKRNRDTRTQELRRIQRELETSARRH